MSQFFASNQFAIAFALAIFAFMIYVFVVAPWLEIRADKRRQLPMVHPTCVYTNPQTGLKRDITQSDREAEKLWEAIFASFGDHSQIPSL